MANIHPAMLSLSLVHGSAVSNGCEHHCILIDMSVAVSQITTMQKLGPTLTELIVEVYGSHPKKGSMNVLCGNLIVDR